MATQMGKKNSFVLPTPWITQAGIAEPVRRRNFPLGRSSLNGERGTRVSDRFPQPFRAPYKGLTSFLPHLEIGKAKMYTHTEATTVPKDPLCRKLQRLLPQKKPKANITTTDGLSDFPCFLSYRYSRSHSTLLLPFWLCPSQLLLREPQPHRKPALVSVAAQEQNTCLDPCCCPLLLCVCLFLHLHTDGLMPIRGLHHSASRGGLCSQKISRSHPEPRSHLRA